MFPEFTTDYPIEYIEWIDSTGYNSGWFPIKDIKDNEAIQKEDYLKCYSIGFVVLETDFSITISDTIEFVNSSIHNALTIPKMAILKRERIS